MYLEAAEVILRSELDARTIFSVVSLPGSPEGLHLIPFSDDSITLITKQHRC